MEMCLLEKWLIWLIDYSPNSRLVLIHDGQRNPGQFELPPEEVKCFTRKYRLKLDNEFVNTWVIFKYDERSQFADFEIVSREPKMWGKQKILLEMAKEVKKHANKDTMPSVSGDAEELADLR